LMMSAIPDSSSQGISTGIENEMLPRMYDLLDMSVVLSIR